MRKGACADQSSVLVIGNIQPLRKVRGNQSAIDWKVVFCFLFTGFSKHWRRNIDAVNNFNTTLLQADTNDSGATSHMHDSPINQGPLSDQKLRNSQVIHVAFALDKIRVVCVCPFPIKANIVGGRLDGVRVIDTNLPFLARMGRPRIDCSRMPAGLALSVLLLTEV